MRAWRIRVWREHEEPTIRAHADAIFDLIGPFYGWKTELRPALSDLKARACAAIFWRLIHEQKDEMGIVSRGLPPENKRYADPYVKRIRGVSVFTPKQIDSLRDSLRDPLQDSLQNSLRASLQDSLGDSLWASLEDSLRDSLWASLEDSLRDSLWASLRDPLGDPLKDSLRFSFWASLRDSFWASLFYGLGFALVNTQPIPQFHTLLDTWRSGNYPVGFDKNDNLMVLVAE
jgi:hypothetical protein